MFNWVKKINQWMLDNHWVLTPVTLTPEEIARQEKEALKKKREEYLIKRHEAHLTQTANVAKYNSLLTFISGSGKFWVTDRDELGNYAAKIATSKSDLAFYQNRLEEVEKELKEKHGVTY